MSVVLYLYIAHTYQRSSLSVTTFLSHGRAAMKVHQMAGLELWEQEPSLSLACKRLRPLAVPKLGHTLSIADLKSFIKPHNNVPTKSSPPQSHEVQSGGTRWNPTGEQIEILERLYRGGMRTPNADQIEQITLQLGKYGKIEGKNVFYWFQNHKARERQRRKRVVDDVDKSTMPAPTPALHAGADQEEDQLAVGQMKLMKSWVPEVMRGFDDSRWYKRFRPWLVKSSEDDEEKGDEQGIQTLELFPLRPGGTS